MTDPVHTTLLEMLTDRGITDVTYPINNLIVGRNASTNTNTVVYRVTDAKVSVKNIKQLKTMLKDYSFNCLIIIYKISVSTFARQFIASDIDNVFVQLFGEHELMFNITKHELVPVHRILTDVEKTAVIKKLGIKSGKQFPIILMDDPICRYYGCVSGTLIEIQRASDTCGTYIFYRLVV
jgi:DNA-directed RNA polymerases I, II, and III subunit RPABC1